VSDEPADLPLGARLRAVIAAKDEQVASLTASLETALERIRRQELRIAELERRLSMDSSDSGTPSSKEPVGAKEARKARQRQESERERSKDRKRGGQPGHKGKGLQRDPDPGDGSPLSRRRNAGPAGRPWTGRGLRASRGGRSPLTCGFSVR